MRKYWLVQFLNRRLKIGGPFASIGISRQIRISKRKLGRIEKTLYQ